MWTQIPLVPCWGTRFLHLSDSRTPSSLLGRFLRTPRTPRKPRSMATCNPMTRFPSQGSPIHSPPAGVWLLVPRVFLHSTLQMWAPPLTHESSFGARLRPLCIMSGSPTHPTFGSPSSSLVGHVRPTRSNCCPLAPLCCSLLACDHMRSPELATMHKMCMRKRDDGTIATAPATVQMSSILKRVYPSTGNLSSFFLI